MTRASNGARSRRECRAAAKELAEASNGEHGPGPEIPRGAPKGDRPVAGNARRLTHAGLARFAKSIAARGSPVVRNERKAGSPGLRIERGVCASVMTRR